jgi:hypothetical protein
MRAVTLARSDEPGNSATGIGVVLRGTEGERALDHVLPLGQGELRTRLVRRSRLCSSRGPTSRQPSTFGRQSRQVRQSE